MTFGSGKRNSLFRFELLWQRVLYLLTYVKKYLLILEDQPAFGRLTSSSCGGLWDRRDTDTSDDSPRACGARLGLEIPLFPPFSYPGCRLTFKMFLKILNILENFDFFENFEFFKKF